MARLRRANAYRRLERPYTRISKYKKRAYIKVRPNSTIVKFDIGNLTKKFPFQVQLVSRNNVQIRHNALESARQTSNRVLEKTIGKKAYHLKIRVFPHHILRENPLASGAGADRMSTGMKKSFGKPISTAARIKKRQIIMHVGVSKANIPTAKLAMKRASQKFPFAWNIVVEETK
tara:strand:+ start:63 stop:587 length:525 start_codon:yes stop_codon:yes gene_type:complete